MNKNGLIDPIGQMMAYEAGELESDQIIDLFQYLIDCGWICQLQGSYQRMAQHLLDNGLVVLHGGAE